MKKIVSILIVLVLCIGLCGCVHGKKIKQYEGTPLTQLTFETVDYHGGFTTTYVFDFAENTVKTRGYLPVDGSKPDFETLTEFTEQQEQTLINKLYSFGLFNIKAEYKSPPGILDGGGWTLQIIYADETTKVSRGSNNTPKAVFKNCATAFYDICHDGIVAHVDAAYYCPPNLSYALQFTVGNTTTSQGSDFSARGNYKWNGFEETSCDIFQINQEFEQPYELNADTKYTLVLYTANYHYLTRFTKCEVSSFDYNENLSGEKIIVDMGWFEQIEFDLELNKIYVIKLSFANGDFVEYTFNTKV